MSQASSGTSGPVSGVEALGVATTANAPSGRCTSHTQPEPKLVKATRLNSCLKCTKSPNDLAMPRPAAQAAPASARTQAPPIEIVVPHLRGEMKQRALRLGDDFFQRQLG